MADDHYRTSAQKRKSPTFPDMVCERCRSICRRGSPIQRFCSPCRVVAKIDRDRGRQKKTEPFIGQLLECGHCRRHVTRTGPTQIYCRECSKTKSREVDKIRQRNRRASGKVGNDDKARYHRRKLDVKFWEQRRQYERDRRRSDPKYMLSCRMRALVAKSLRGKKAGRKWETLVGYTADVLIAHIERQFLPKMTWENRDLWEVDHIIPVSAFDFETVEDSSFRACWSLTNLRPLWRSENRRKSGKRTLIV